MTPELREQVVQYLKRWDFNRWQADAMICDFIAPLLAEERRAGHAEGQNLANDIVAAIVAQAEREARRRGAEQGWDEGVAERRMEDGSEQPVRDNPYRADQPSTERICPSCRVERADYEGPRMHLPDCPNCGSHLTPRVDQPQHNHDPIGVYNGCPACGTDWASGAEEPPRSEPSERG